MKANELKNRLIEDARKGGICADGYKLMRKYNLRQLIEYYLANPDWCMERNFPSLDVIQSEFGNIEDMGVYVGKKFDGEVFDQKQVYIFHNCRGTIRVAMNYEKAIIPMLYFANDCNIRVICDQVNITPINVPLYIVYKGNNRAIAAKGKYCKFKRYKIKPL